MEKIMLQSSAGALEGVYQPAKGRWGVLVIAHPHPLHGGTMDNKVVTTLFRLGKELEMPSLRFNFRGVGASEGVHDNAVGEVDDMLAAIEWIRQQHMGVKVFLAGFSFGSYVALKAAEAMKGKIESVLLVAPPVHHYPFEQIESVGCPVSLIQGAEDEVVPAEEVFAWADSSPLNPTVTPIPECGHFFHGKLLLLKEWAKKHLPDDFE